MPIDRSSSMPHETGVLCPADYRPVQHPSLGAPSSSTVLSKPLFSAFMLYFDPLFLNEKEENEERIGELVDDTREKVCN